jgi:hypothetical protein
MPLLPGDRTRVAINWWFLDGCLGLQIDISIWSFLF